MEGYVLNIPCRIMCGEQWRSRYRTELISLPSYYWNDEKRLEQYEEWKIRKESAYTLTDNTTQKEALPTAKWYDATLISVTPENTALVHIHDASRLMIVPIEHVQYRVQ